MLLNCGLPYPATVLSRAGVAAALQQYPACIWLQLMSGIGDMSGQQAWLCCARVSGVMVMQAGAMPSLGHDRFLLGLCLCGRIMQSTAGF